MIQNTIERKIMWGDLDSLGIVFYPRYYEWIDGSSHLFFEKIDLGLTKLWNRYQLIFSLVETSCRYLRPGRYHQVICINTRITELERKTITLNHTISDKLTGNVMVEGIEKRICMGVKDPKDFKAIDIPAEIRDIMKPAL